MCSHGLLDTEPPTRKGRQPQVPPMLEQQVQGQHRANKTHNSIRNKILS
jgi:hypothetical protein